MAEFEVLCVVTVVRSVLSLRFVLNVIVFVRHDIIRATTDADGFQQEARANQHATSANGRT